MLKHIATPRNGWRKLRLCVAVALLALPLVLPAGATGESDDGSSGNGPHVQMVERNGVRHYTASASASGRGQVRPLGSLSLWAAHQSIVAIGSGYEVEAKNQISANVGAARWVRYNYAQTRRLSGSGTYRAEAHAVLIRGDSYEVDPVFDVYKRPCAGISRVNRTARTCGSSRFRTSPGEEWLVISGHTYDHGNDNDPEWTVAGRLDYVWTASRR